METNRQLSPALGFDIPFLAKERREQNTRPLLAQVSCVYRFAAQERQ
jgi:hypothetical protein